MGVLSPLISVLLIDSSTGSPVHVLILSIQAVRDLLRLRAPGIVPCIFTARCYASAVLAMALCPSVRQSVRPSQVGVLLKRLNVGSYKQHHTIAHGL